MYSLHTHNTPYFQTTHHAFTQHTILSHNTHSSNTSSLTSTFSHNTPFFSYTSFTDTTHYTLTQHLFLLIYILPHTLNTLAQHSFLLMPHSFTHYPSPSHITLRSHHTPPSSQTPHHSFTHYPHRPTLPTSHTTLLLHTLRHPLFQDISSPFSHTFVWYTLRLPTTPPAFLTQYSLLSHTLPLQHIPQSHTISIFSHNC
jgi:hypothetical protein